MLLFVLLLLHESAVAVKFDVASDFIKLEVAVADDFTGISSLSLHAGDYWTVNFIDANRSTTGLKVGDMGFFTAAGGVVETHSETLLVISNITIGTPAVIAVETWIISLQESSFVWNISRTFEISGDVSDDRFPSLGFISSNMVGTSARSSAVPQSYKDAMQMPSFVSLDNMLNEDDLAYTLPGDSWRALIGDPHNKKHRILLSPSGLELLTEFDVCRFSFARPNSVLVSSLAIASQCALPASFSAAAGTSVENSFRLSVSLATTGHGIFSLTGMRDLRAQHALSEYAKIFNMFMSSIFGNSPACETCVHEASLFSQLQGLYSIGGVDGNPSVHKAIGKFLTFLYDHVVTEEGRVFSRWNLIFGIDENMPGIVDQYPHIVLAAYYYGVNTGDKETVSGWMEKLDKIMGYQMKTMRMDNFPYVFINTQPECNGRANFSCADNWNDDIRFGWKDSIVGAYAVESVKKFADLKIWLGDTEGGEKLLKKYERLVRAYREEFWDEKNSQFCDWIDVDGGRRNYFYVWQNYAAIEFGIADEKMTQKILARADTHYKTLARSYNVSDTDLFCAPTNFIPVKTEDITVNWEGEFVYPNYENGDCFLLMSGLEIMARARGVGPSEGFRRFLQLVPQFEKSRFWAQRYKWLTKEGYGVDVITDALYAVYATIFGALNIRPSLTGIEILGAPAAEMEGARFVFAHLGEDISATVVNGLLILEKII